MHTKRLVALGMTVAAMTSAGALAAGCGSSSSSSNAPATTAATTPETDTTATAPATGGTGTAVTVDLGKGQEFAVVPSVTSAPAGNITFTVVNDGKMMHEMVVVPEPAGGAQALKKADGSADETGSPGEAPDIAAGATKKVTLDLKAGKYLLLCNLPGHFAGGMYTEFTVT
ncbi:MAG: sulfocyanin-like copper-binding protein [Thermoleophilia bacterium]